MGLDSEKLLLQVPGTRESSGQTHAFSPFFLRSVGGFMTVSVVKTQGLLNCKNAPSRGADGDMTW